ncbi:FkbM family methyltransferase [Amorphus orientalis]|uniref:FkbM family methyltransferase n=1 Tax=Amorphus orientalis TaxID=649198 RepID=A0AAE3VRE4_9HYPH|nr:FkbM family methyltransferase [Amorphus orientalis]MDQ0317364.1 FkbM family methyltransferase [Amorphus orientalis]
MRYAYYPQAEETVPFGAGFSFAQNFEDIYLWRALRDVEAGFYVDIGALHPVTDSVTKLFYDAGWSGLNVEPGSTYSELASARGRDINLQVVVGEDVGDVSFLEVQNGGEGLSHVAGQGADTVSAWPTVAMRRKSLRLADLLDDHAAGRTIHFLKIDVEGSEASVIRSADWSRHRPWILVVEATRPTTSQLCHDEWEPILIEAGYVRAFFDGLNMYYVRDESRHLLDAFDRPVSVLDGFRKFEPTVAAMHAELNARDRAIDTLRQRAAALLRAGHDVQAMRAHLAEEIAGWIVPDDRGGPADCTADRQSEAASALERVKTRYRLDGAPAELRFGLWVARKLRKVGRTLRRWRLPFLQQIRSQ